ncbi:acetyltransferase [Serinicoccus profundi]|uniref:acetyltransferase n=1 Tax=Serinicoccus profundi TaxID=1078471 RepID=UPI000255E84A|nr:acetyltransferase [Serinicoccus profundi]
MRDLTIVGAGGFGREAWCLASLLNDTESRWGVVAIRDDRPAHHRQLCGDLGADILGPIHELDTRVEEVVVAVGDPSIRRSITQRLPSDTRFATLVHPRAHLGPRVTLGDGCVVAAGATLSTNIQVGNHVHIDQNATIGHDCVLGDFARVNPAACLSGTVYVGHGALVGANATVLQGLDVGAEAVVGAGAVVTRAVAATMVVKGVPAR